MNINDRIIIRFKESEETINLEETFKVQISGGTTLNYDEETGKIQLLDKKNNVLSEIDLPTERVIKSVRYDETTSELVFEFDYAQEIRVPIGDLFNLEDYFNKEQTLSLLNEKANKSEIPTKLSQLSNDEGYLTSVPSEYAKKNELFDKDYNKLINKPNIPSKLSDLDIDMELGVNEEEVLEIVENNSNQVSDEYTLATSQDVDKTSDNQLPTSKAVQKLIDESTPKIDLPTKLSDFENDKLFVNEQEVVEIVEEKIDESSTATQNAINSVNDKITQLQELINNNEIDIEQKNTLVNNSIVEINKDIEGIKQILTSDDVDYDTLQELVNALKNNVSSISDIFTELSKKVDKVNGKDLSTNDYTTEEKNKLKGIEAGANNYILPTDVVQDSTYRHITVTPTSVTDGTYTFKKYVLPTDVVQDSSYVHTDNNYTTVEKNKLAGLSNYDDTAVKNALDNKANKSELFSKDYNDLTNKPTIPISANDVGAYTKEETQELINNTKPSIEYGALVGYEKSRQYDATALPTTDGTFVENVYINTNLSVEEVVNIIESANIDFSKNSSVTLLSVEGYSLFVLKKIYEESINNYYYRMMFAGLSFFTSYKDVVNYGDSEVGWDNRFFVTHEGNIIELNEVICSIDGEGRPVCDKNELLKAIISITPVSDLGEKTQFYGVKNDGSLDKNKPLSLGGSYNDLTDKPTIPTKTSELENDSSFVTENSLNEFPRMFQASSNITLFEAWNPEMYDEDYVKTLILQLKNILGDSVRKKGYAQLEAYIDFPASNGKKYSTGLIQKDEDCFYGMINNRAEVYFYHYDDSFQVQLLVFSEDRATSFMMNITLYNDGNFSRKFEDNITGDILTLEEVETMELLDSIRIYNFLVLYQEV